MSDIGERLKAIRTKKNLSIDDVASGTGIRAQYLEALENSEFSNIPGDVFIKGFIRNYGNYLGLDGNALVEEYKQGTKAASTGISTPSAPEAPVTTEEEVQAAVSAAEERNQQRTKPKSSFGHGIKNAWEDIKSFVYDNLYETVDDDEEEEEEEKPAPSAPVIKKPDMAATRKINIEPPVSRKVTSEPVKEKSSFFNYKAFAGVFIVLLLIFLGVMAYFIFGGKNPNASLQTTKISTGVKSAHSTENKSKDADTTKQEDKDQPAKQNAATDTKDAKTADKAKAESSTVGEGDGVTVEITYKKPVWTQVTADGKGIEAATIPAGTTKTFKGNKEVKVNLGSVRDVTIKVNGKEVPYGEKEWGTVTKVFKK
jgi:cytoskeletal protein RodZ